MAFTIINGVLVGSFVGLLLAIFSAPLWVATSVSLVAFLVSVGIHQRYQWGQWRRLARTIAVRFPQQSPRQNPVQ